MSTTWTVYSSLSTNLLAPFTAAAALASGAIMPVVLSLLLSGLTIKIMWIGFETIRGKGSANIFLDVFANSLRVGLVIAIGLGVGYSANVVPFLDEFLGWLGGLYGGGVTGSTSTVSMFTDLDNGVIKAWDTMKDIYKFGMLPDNFSLNPLAPNLNGLMMIFAGFIMVAGFLIYTLIAFYNLLFIKLALIFLYSIGPLFIASFAFPSLSKWFENWLTAVMSYGFTGVVILMVTSMGNFTMSKFATDMQAIGLDNMDYFVLGGKALIGMIILAKFVTLIPELAAKLAGSLGIQLNAPGFGGLAKSAINYAKGRSTPTPTQIAGPSTSISSVANTARSKPSAAVAGIRAGIGQAARGTGQGIGSIARGAGQGIGEAAAGIGAGVGTLASEGAMGLVSMISKLNRSGTGTITGSNARPAGEGIQSMLNKTNNS